MHYNLEHNKYLKHTSIVCDKISKKCMLDNQIMLSLNQTHAQIKILEIWKATNIENNPSKVSIIRHENSDCTTRDMTTRQLKEHNTPSTCLGDAIRLWNRAPDSIR